MPPGQENAEVMSFVEEGLDALSKLVVSPTASAAGIQMVASLRVFLVIVAADEAARMCFLASDIVSLPINYLFLLQKAYSHATFQLFAVFK